MVRSSYIVGNVTNRTGKLSFVGSNEGLAICDLGIGDAGIHIAVWEKGEVDFWIVRGEDYTLGIISSTHIHVNTSDATLLDF